MHVLSPLLSAASSLHWPASWQIAACGRLAPPIVADKPGCGCRVDAGKVELDGARYLNFNLPFSISQLVWIEAILVGGAEIYRNRELDPETRIYPGMLSSQALRYRLQLQNLPQSLAWQCDRQLGPAVVWACSWSALRKAIAEPLILLSPAQN